MTDDDSRFLRALTATQSVLVEAPDTATVLEELSALAAQALGDDVSCSITSRYDRHPVTVASSDDLAAEVDEVQYGQGGGPCLHALDTGEMVDVPDVPSDRRWPEYGRRAAEAGVGSSLSMPIAIDGQVGAALNSYSRTPGHFVPARRERAERFAEQAGDTVTLAVRAERQGDLVEHLERAMTSRRVIDQALGILMAQQRCGADEAFALLRNHSQNNNVKLRDLAEQIVSRTGGQPASQDPGFRR